jgi:hypothetical protein
VSINGGFVLPKGVILSVYARKRLAANGAKKYTRIIHWPEDVALLDTIYGEPLYWGDFKMHGWSTCGLLSLGSSFGGSYHMYLSNI